MSLHEQIKKEVQQALKEKDIPRLNALRNMTASFTNEAITKGKTPSGILTDEETLAVITKLVKQRKESIEQFEKGGRPELAQAEKDELIYLQKYLPQMMNAEDIKKVILAKKEELGVTDKAKMGLFMGAVMKELKGKADGTVVKEIVESLFK